MPRLSNALPKYRRKVKPNGPQAVVTIGGKDHYLGPYGSKASRVLYDRLVSEWLAGGRVSRSSDGDEMTVEELIAAYYRYAKREKFRRADGTPTETIERIKYPLRVLRQHYGDIAANDFGPVALKALRSKMIQSGNSRLTINHDVDRIRAVFRWGVSEELVEESLYRRLLTVEGLRKGLTEAKESEPVEPVSDAVVELTLPHLPEVVADMVRFCRLTGCRPGEACRLRPVDVEAREDHHIYRPLRHKTEHHNKVRAVLIGPRAYEILQKYLDREPDAYCFDPREAMAKHRKKRSSARVTPLSCGTKPGDRAIQNRGRKSKQALLGNHYTNDSFRRAIHRACDRAFPPEAPLAPRPREAITARNRRLSAKQREELAKWQSEHRWSPNQLRHSAATEIRKKFGIEAVAASLGHSKTDTSEIYAERNLDLAAQVAKELG